MNSRVIIGELSAFQPIALEQVAKGPVMVAKVVIGFGKCEVQINLLVRGERGQDVYKRQALFWWRSYRSRPVATC